MNTELIEHLKHFEGFVGHPYRCPAGYLTIGYGHRIDKAEPTWSEEKATAVLLEDIAKYTEMAMRMSRDSSGRPVLEDNSRRLAAIIDFCFNAGGAAYAGSMLRQRVIARRWDDAAYENGRWIYVTDPKTRKKNKSAWQIKRRAVTSEWLRKG